MKFYQLVVLFLIINFGGLYIGNLLMNNGPTSSWYMGLKLAPWTPPGWVFGFAWTTIMICFSVYMAYAWTKVSDLKLLAILFAVQWVIVLFVVVTI